jgi:hypothetical protein
LKPASIRIVSRPCARTAVSVKPICAHSNRCEHWSV